MSAHASLILPSCHELPVDTSSSSSTDDDPYGTLWALRPLPPATSLTAPSAPYGSMPTMQFQIPPIPSHMTHQPIQYTSTLTPTSLQPQLGPMPTAHIVQFPPTIQSLPTSSYLAPIQSSDPISPWGSPAMFVTPFGHNRPLHRLPRTQAFLSQHRPTMKPIHQSIPQRQPLSLLLPPPPHQSLHLIHTHHQPTHPAHLRMPLIVRHLQIEEVGKEGGLDMVFRALGASPMVKKLDGQRGEKAQREFLRCRRQSGESMESFIMRVQAQRSVMEEEDSTFAVGDRFLVGYILDHAELTLKDWVMVLAAAQNTMTSDSRGPFLQGTVPIGKGVIDAPLLPELLPDHNSQTASLEAGMALEAIVRAGNRGSPTRLMLSRSQQAIVEKKRTWRAGLRSMDQCRKSWKRLLMLPWQHTLHFKPSSRP